MKKTINVISLILLGFTIFLSGCSLFEKNESKDSTTKTSKDILTVHFLDVGQGDSIFIELPTKQTILIDAGEKKYSKSIIDYINNCGYSKIDYVIATHPHSDHIGGLANVINAFEIDKIYMTNALSTTVTYENLLTTIQNKGKKMTRAKAGVEVINSENLKAEFVAPVSDEYKDLNNYSAVLKLSYFDNSFLFTGDAEELSENEITANIDVYVLKVGHHGSAYSTSSDFLQKVTPQYAVISVGEDNDYGHPHSETLSRLDEYSVKYFRTDLQGTIIFTCDGVNISIDKTLISNSEVATDSQNNSNATVKYVLNTGSKKIHRYDCSSVSKISENNYSTKNDFEKAIADGYEPCKICNPE